jgi:hypothetical protein
MAKRLTTEFKQRIASEMRQATAEYQKKKGDPSARPASVMRHAPGIAPGVEGIIMEYAEPGTEIP